MFKWRTLDLNHKHKLDPQYISWIPEILQLSWKKWNGYLIYDTEKKASRLK